MDIHQERSINIMKNKYRKSFNKIKRYKEVKCRLFDTVLDIYEKYREGDTSAEYNIKTRLRCKKLIENYFKMHLKIPYSLKIYYSVLCDDVIYIEIFFKD